MSNLENLVGNAMQSCIEGYAASVVDSIEFELKRELSTEEHQQVYAAVDCAITGIDAAQKENGELVMSLNVANDATNIWKDRAQKAEAELSAANEKLKGEPVLVCRINANELQRLKNGSYAIVDAPERNPTDMGLFTGTQPVVLHPANNIANIGDNRHLWHQRDLMWQSAIKAAGGKVEGD